MAMFDGVVDSLLSTIKEKIFNKFRNELELAKKVTPPNVENAHIRKFESAIKHLPETMRNALEVDLRHCKDDINLLIQDNNMVLKNVLVSDDLHSMKEFLKKNRDSEGMKSYTNQVEDTIRKQMQDVTRISIQQFDDHDIVEALNNIKKLYNYKIQLDKLVDGIQQHFSTIQSRIKIVFHDAYLIFTNRFLNDQSLDTSQDANHLVERSFICLIEFMKFNSAHKDQTSLIDLFPNDFNKKKEELNRSILQYLTEQENKTKNALEKFDVSALKTSLDTLNRWNSIIMKMKTYDNMYNSNDTSIISIANAIKTFKSYSQLSKIVIDLIENLQEELIALNLINNQTEKVEKHRNEFYVKLNEKYLFLQKASLMLDTYNMNIDLHKIERECIESLKQKIFRIASLAENFVEKNLANTILIEAEIKDFKTHYETLLSFKQEMKVKGIDINEAIEIGLLHANREHEREPITQVILIGDAPPNQKNEVQKKREYLGENYWSKGKFAQATYYEDELAKLKSQNIKVHAFFVEEKAEQIFRLIATNTGGRCEMLDINSSSGSDLLTNLVTEEILRNVGGDKRGNELVRAYREQFDNNPK